MASPQAGAPWGPPVGALAEPPPPQVATTLLAFRIERELFALPVDCVHEILDPMEPTEVPLAPPHAPALVNVRGVIVPLFDLRQRLCIRPQPEGRAGRLVVIETLGGGVATKLAFLADAVEGVVEIDGTDLDPLPPLGSRWPEAFVSGLVRSNGELVVLLAPETLFSPSASNPPA